MAPVAAAILAAALSAGCGGDPAGLVSGWARVSGTVRTAAGAPVAGVTPSFAVFRDAACTERVLTTVHTYPEPPVTDAAGHYQTEVLVHAWGAFQGCLAVTANGVTVHVPASFAGARENAPAVQVDVSVP
ncbi:MAG TPA: hypothetical protein VEQ60_11575 [Longimicrobium sp.]|nr:hypothetical protein [Longimicrobium sp.]